MKEKNQTKNSCLISGKVTRVEDLEDTLDLDEICLDVETEVPGGGKTVIICYIKKKWLHTPLRAGERVMLTGNLTGGVDKDGLIVGAWVDVQHLGKLLAGTKIPFINSVTVYGTPIEGGCLIDHGHIEAADLTLAVKGIPYCEELEVGCIAHSAQSVQDYLDTLGCEKLAVEGALEICEPETVKEGMTILVHAERIRPWNDEEEGGEQA